jgi:SAM-dependent methyltransferase
MKKEINVAKTNAEAWDNWSADGVSYTVPIKHEAFLKAKMAELEVFLTPSLPVPQDWFPELEGLQVLGLASGGGQQMPLFTAKGAVCTVFDNSYAQLAAEKMVAKREHYQIQIVKGDMAQSLPFEDKTFELIFNPVSTCYIRHVEPLWKECFRVLKPGGVLMTGFSAPITWAFNVTDKPVKEVRVANKLPYDPVALAEAGGELTLEYGSLQFSHSLETQLNGQIKAGFCLTHILDDSDCWSPVGQYIPLYMLTRAIKPQLPYVT